MAKQRSKHSRLPEVLVGLAAAAVLFGMLYLVWSDATGDVLLPETAVTRPATLVTGVIEPLHLPHLAMQSVMTYAPAVNKPVESQTAPPRGDGASIAIVIDDCGLSDSGTRGAIALPNAVTLSFLPYGTNSHSLAKLARERGHDIMLHMPMQPLGSADPGPDALTVGLPHDVVSERVRQGFARIPDVVGLNNHMGSRFTEDAEGLQPVMREIKARNLFFLDSMTSAHSVGVSVAREAGVPVLSRDVFLDDVVTEEEVVHALALAERIARQRGAAIAIGHPHPSTLKVLNQWIAGLDKRGFRLVSVRSLLEPKTGVIAVAGHGESSGHLKTRQ